MLWVDDLLKLSCSKNPEKCTVYEFFCATYFVSSCVIDCIAFERSIALLFSRFNLNWIGLFWFGRHPICFLFTLPFFARSSSCSGNRPSRTRYSVSFKAPILSAEIIWGFPAFLQHWLKGVEECFYSLLWLQWHVIYKLTSNIRGITQIKMSAYSRTKAKNVNLTLCQN